MPVSSVRGGAATADLSSRLPADLAEFVGRERELERLAAALTPAGSVVVVAGMPGSGKTALAAHLAHSLPAFAPAEVAFASAAELGRHGYDLKRYRSSPLLIADGLKRHEIDALLAQLERPEGMVVTTRDLGYRPRTASLIRLGPLSAGEGMRLLGFLAGPQRISRDDDSAAEIVRLCGGLPLALRVAGRQLAGQPRTGLREFAEQIRRRRWRDDSRQAVAGVFDEARAGLPDPARRAFPLLAVAGETFPASKWDAILAVLDVPGRTETGGRLPGPQGGRARQARPAEIGGALVQAGLLEPQGDGAWRAHPLVVSFAQALLSRDAGLRTAAANAMIRWHARTGVDDLPAVLRAVQVAGAWAPRSAVDDLAAVADSALLPLWDKRLWPQWEQLHRAVRSAADRLAEPALQTAAAANQVIGYLAQHRLSEADTELRRAAGSRPDGYPAAAGARLWLAELTLRWLQGDLDGAERLATRALAEANQVESPGMVMLVRLVWAHLERDRGNVRAAIAQWTDIASDAAREALPEIETLALVRAAKGSVEVGLVDRARELLTRAVSSAQLQAITLAELARLEQANGHADRAYASARRAATLQFGPAEPLDLGPKWIWWPRTVHHAATLAVCAAVVGLPALAGAPLYMLLGAALALVPSAMGLLRWTRRTRERLTLNVFRAIQRWLDAPELAAEVVPLSRLHYNRLAGGDR